jgi:hypothetical protein
MKKWMLLLFIFISRLAAYDDRPECYKDLSHNFFNLQITQRALSLYLVPQPQWDRIFREVTRRANDEAPAILQQKARARHPSPFEAPFQRDEAEKILRETMHDIFYRVVVEYGFYDPTSINDMFDYI